MQTKQDQDVQRIMKLVRVMNEQAKNYVAALAVAMLDSREGRLAPKLRAKLALAFRVDDKEPKGDAVRKFLIQHRYLTGAGKMGQRTLKVIFPGQTQ
jgi:hypothetical protein